LPQDLLGRHVRARAGRHAAGVARFLSRDLSNPEIGQLQNAVAAHEHVGGLDVAMQDAERVNGCERAEQLREVMPSLRER